MSEIESDYDREWQDAIDETLEETSKYLENVHELLEEIKVERQNVGGGSICRSRFRDIHDRLKRIRDNVTMLDEELFPFYEHSIDYLI